MFEPFLAIVKLLELKLLPLSINVTSLPIAGDAGSVIVTEPLYHHLKMYQLIIDHHLLQYMLQALCSTLF